MLGFMFLSFEMSLFSFFSVPVSFFFFFLLIFIISSSMQEFSFNFVVSEYIFMKFLYNFQAILSIFFLILYMNFFSLLPYSFAFSSMQSTLVLSFFFWASFFFFLFFSNLNSNISHFLPVGTPGVLVFLLVWIEVISCLARPLALSVRLVANIMASHLLIHLSTSSLSFLSFWSIMLIPFLLLLVFLEFCVSLIQSYVFTMLLSLYTEELS